ncbi:MAG: hypothetical protein AB8G17_17840 [Gammaproteobacteria bacterium]
MSPTPLDLWMPILLAAFLAWLSSSLIHILLKYHNGDYLELGNEDDVANAIRAGSPSPGVYTIPFCVDMKKMGDPAMQEKFANGPVSFVTVFPNGMPQMGKLIGQQMLFFLFGCFLIAYCAGLALAPGAEYLAVFRFVSAVGFLTFGWGLIPFSIWYGLSALTTAKYMLDALIYALIVAGVFAWLWPAV